MSLFRRNKRDGDGYWQTKVSAEHVAENDMIPLTLGEHDVIVTRLPDGAIAVFSGTCPHAAADLADGTLHRGRITCPLHDWKFDIKTGRALWPEDEGCRLKRFDYKVIEGILSIRT